ncbi:MAG: homoserine O-succinyltransferase [Chloroflexi bacterium]|nr:MAG: homoserine O-succinyltransferase [Chloroflexota bacterium]
MPLVAHMPLPTLDNLKQRGQEVLSLEQARRQDIRELHIGFLNMMPDAALRATEQQFLRLVGSSNQIAQFFVYPFSIPGLPRSPETKAYIDRYYTTFEQLQQDGLDALIITGANVANPTLNQEPFWEPLQQIINWASEHVTSVLCSCLATHAILQALHSIERRPLPKKRWGVYTHRITQVDHPLLLDTNTRFDVPHSRNNDVSRAQLEAAGFTTLVYSEEGGVHMAVSPDQFRIVYLQGHPEYDRISLLKEYKREVNRFINGERDDYPPHPDNYFSPEAATIVDEYQIIVQAGLRLGTPIPPFPESKIEPHLDNTWRDTGRAIFNNWLGLVYQLTNVDRKIPFVPGVDPNDPLGLKNK